MIGVRRTGLGINVKLRTKQVSRDVNRTLKKGPGCAGRFAGGPETPNRQWSRDSDAEEDVIPDSPPSQDIQRGAAIKRVCIC